VGQAPRCVLEGPQKVHTPYYERPSDGDHLELFGWGVDLSGKVLAPPAGSHYLCCTAGRCWLVKTLLEGLPDHAPLGSVMLADLFMDIKDQRLALLRGDTPLKDA
jgi:hypothetical protein